jgi:hypothetical protein
MEGCTCVLNNIVNILQEKDLLNKILKTEIKENSVIANLFVFFVKWYRKSGINLLKSHFAPQNHF